MTAASAGAELAARVALPLVLEAGEEGEPIAAALPRLRAALDLARDPVGGALLRGFAIAAEGGLGALARGSGHPLLSYDFASTPRSLVGDGVYSSTEYPAHQEIPLHNEQSYAREWPMKIWFHCVTAAASGGETPIADSRAVHAAIDPALRRRFEERGLCYVRNYGGGLDLPWQRTFATEDRSRVEAYCRAHAIAWTWKEDGQLCTRQVAQVVARHPRTGEAVWFNQAHLFHPSALEPSVREALLDAVGPDELPRTVTHADGGAIDASALDEVRAAYAAARVVFRWRAGDVLVLDNMLTAHGRAAFRGSRRVVVAMTEPHRAGPA